MRRDEMRRDEMRAIGEGELVFFRSVVHTSVDSSMD